MTTALLISSLLVALGSEGVDRVVPEEGPRVLIISVDGLRSDLLLLAAAPHMEQLYRGGSFSFWAKTTPSGVTLPSHASMLTGVDIAKHGITWNVTETPANVRSPHPKVPTLFELARNSGISSALIAGKPKFWHLLRPESANWSFVPEETISDRAVGDHAVRIIEAHGPRVLFLHLAGVDVVGHEEGWGSPAQMAAIEEADRVIGTVFDALVRRQLFRKTLVILTSDHGGYLLNHDGVDPRSRHIPWVIYGPGVKRAFDLASARPQPIVTEDTFATACQHLRLPTPDWVDGRPIHEAFETRPELQPASPR